MGCGSPVRLCGGQGERWSARDDNGLQRVHLAQTKNRHPHIAVVVWWVKSGLPGGGFLPNRRVRASAAAVYTHKQNSPPTSINRSNNSLWHTGPRFLLDICRDTSMLPAKSTLTSPPVIAARRILALTTLLGSLASAAADSRRRPIGGKSYAEEPEVRSPHRRPLRPLKVQKVLLLPGFASSRMRNYANTDCRWTGLPLDFSFGSDVWIDISKIVASKSCWLHCIKLDSLTQRDARNPRCMVRADDGFDAISELAPGTIPSHMQHVDPVIRSKCNHSNPKGNS